jgi:UPF0755 protein
MKRLFYLVVIASILLAILYVVLEIIKITEPISISKEDTSTFLLIPSASSHEDVLQILQNEPYLLEGRTLRLISKIINYNDVTVKAGRYLIPSHISSWRLLTLLKSGSQTPINVILNNERTVYQLAGKLSHYLEPDSLTFLDSLLFGVVTKDLGYTSENIMTLFIPNTYQFFWNIGVDQFIDRMKVEHDKFWRKERRKEKADSLGLTIPEVYILASIVEKESQNKGERSTIAGLYLNRLRIGMKLQADPTVVFAVGDFTLKRILSKHLEFDSPYNTYLYEGLPPGPITMSSINSIDAVLNAEDHDYLFMCAAPGYSGQHVFAKTFSEHTQNATEYRKWLNKEGIR